MSAARDILYDLAELGATIQPAGDRLILRAGPKPIPATLVSRHPLQSIWWAQRAKNAAGCFRRVPCCATMTRQHCWLGGLRCAG